MLKPLLLLNLEAIFKRISGLFLMYVTTRIVAYLNQNRESDSSPLLKYAAFLPDF